MGQSIKIKIAGNEYPLVASSPEMERLMRLAAEAINQKLTAYDAKYPNKSLSDKLSFVALNEAVGRLTYQKKLSDAGDEAKALQEDVEAAVSPTCFNQQVPRNREHSGRQGQAKVTFRDCTPGVRRWISEPARISNLIH